MTPLILSALLLTIATARTPDVLRKLRATEDASHLELQTRDLARALTPRPLIDSHVHGETTTEAFASMNTYLEADAVQTSKCNSFTHEQLDDVARILHASRTPELNNLYASKNDKRAFHFDADTLEYKEQLWEVEVATNTTRDGKCAEMVMWYIHHLSATQRERLSEVTEFTLPLMPIEAASIEQRAAEHDSGREYDLQISCSSCHVTVALPGQVLTPLPPSPVNQTQYPMQCPIDESTGLPTVWYEEGNVVGKRIKRCDWDYKPFCQPCEGVGGLIWGSGKDDWNPMPCEPVAFPNEIPADNLTSPLWPKAFVVEEIASLTFPGTDPCDVGFDNSTYKLFFDTREDPTDYYHGPLYHSVGHTGPSGPAPVPGSSWAVGNGNFYNSVDRNEVPAFCTCLGTPDRSRPEGEAITGPLRYDFNDNALLIGRERIMLEYAEETGNGEVVADHWVKGPHHFWIDVATNLMVREWQPFNGHQVYFQWEFRTPTPEEIEVPKICYEGLRNINISCVGPAPDGTTSEDRR